MALASTACRQIVGFDQETPRSQDAGLAREAGVYVSTSGFWHFSDRVCGACIDGSCEGVAKACAADPTCWAYEECRAACGSGDAPCAAHCLGSVPSAIVSTETRALNHCEATECGVACPSSVVSLPNGQTCGPLLSSTECTSCCCAEFSACDTDPDCVRQIACGRACNLVDGAFGQSCIEACTGRSPDPLGPNTHIGACVESTRCQSACFSDDWSCLGKVRWPDPSVSGSWKLYGSVFDYLLSLEGADAALAGFHVKGCFPRDALCQEPFEDVVSDDAGQVVLDLSKNPFGTSAFFEVTAPAGLDYPPHIFFLPPWTLLHSLSQPFAMYARNSADSIPLDDPTLGGVLFFTNDCIPVPFHPAGGVEVQASSAAGLSAPPTYVTPGYRADPNATSTNGSGIGFFTNLPPGQVILTARRHETGERIGATAVVVQPDAMTIAFLAPTP